MQETSELDVSIFKSNHDLISCTVQIMQICFLLSTTCFLHRNLITQISRQIFTLIVASTNWRCTNQNDMKCNDIESTLPCCLFHKVVVREPFHKHLLNKYVSNLFGVCTECSNTIAPIKDGSSHCFSEPAKEIVPI